MLNGWVLLSKGDYMDAIYSDLKEKHVLITGGSNGIGAALCRGFARQGAVVTILDCDVDMGRELIKECSLTNDRMTLIEVDVTKSDELCTVLERVKQNLPPVDVLIPNAGYDPRYSSLDMSETQWNELFQLNMTHYFIICREVLPSMIEAGGGNIIMTASHTAWLGKPDLIAYNATKAAIIGFTRSLAEAEGKHNIRVNAVAPGWTMTERQIRQWATEQAKKETIEREQALPIELTAELLLGTYLFLASDSSRPITRQVLVADAGQAKG